MTSTLCRQRLGRQIRLAVTILLTCSITWLGVAATDAARGAEKELPSGQALLDKYLKATGGKAAYAKINNRVSKATMEIARQGIKLSLTIYAAKPNRLYTLLESDAIGKVESGTDGSVVWENSLLKGPAIKKGTERSNTLRDATFDRLVYWRKIYSKAQCVGKQVVSGKPAFKVVLTPKPSGTAATTSKPSPQTVTLYIDEASSLITKVASKVVTAMGTIPIEIYLSDYKKVDGILIPHKLETRLLNQKRITTIHSVKHNQDLTKRFQLPDEIKALVKKQSRNTR